MTVAKKKSSSAQRGPGEVRVMLLRIELHHFVTHRDGIFAEETPRIKAGVHFHTVSWTG